MGIQQQSIVIVGGGIGGLAAATFLARAGHSVSVLEQSQAIGGRARTQIRQGFSFDQGPHALYRGGEAEATLHALGIQPRGRKPSVSGFAVINGRLYPLAATPTSLLLNRSLTMRGKFELIRVLSRMRTLRDRAPQQSIAAWFRQHITDQSARDYLGALTRVATYCADHDHLAATDALAQISTAIDTGVLYLDGGWQQIVDDLTVAARDSGVLLHSGVPVDRIERDDAVRGVRSRDGQFWPADAVIVAGGPHTARELLADRPSTALTGWAAQTRPVYAATLAVALHRMPEPKRIFALGIDRPLYYSVHSATARVTPGDGALIHTLKYLTGDVHDAENDRRELEALLDLIQPRWRDVLVDSQFLPHMRVINDLADVARGGVAGRPGPEVPDVAGLYVVGDWVGPRGMLVDASLSSARAAASACDTFIRQHIDAAISV